MLEIWSKIRSWLLPGVLIMGILGAATVPAAYSYTYAGRSESPDHILTYTGEKMVWDDATGINEDGVAEMDLFDGCYTNVTSEDGEILVAPGTGKTSIVRLKNDKHESMKYTAVLYCTETDENLPVEVVLNGSNFTETDTYTLPEGVSQDQVITAVQGTLDGNQIQDFDVSWDWDFYQDDAQDAADTEFGNREDADHMTVGLYFQAENRDEVIIPETPQTGDTSTPVGPYLVLMLISGAVVILLLIERKRRTENK